MTWRVARSLNQLLEQINRAAPNRSKKSDGSIGDAAHASRDSDHNPWVTYDGQGIVTARDYTHDPAGGFDAYAFAETLRQNRDGRIKYVISNRRMCRSYAKTIGGRTYPAWSWAPYDGENPHDKHTHVSVQPDHARFDSTAAWDLTRPGQPGAGDPTPSEDDVTPGDITAVAEKVVALLEPRLQAYKVSLTKWDQQTDAADAQRAGDAAEREILTDANLDRIAAAVVAKLQAAGQ